MRRVLTRLPARYGGLRLDREKLRAATFLLLFQRSSMALAVDACLAAERGDRSGLALMQLAYDGLLPRIVHVGRLRLQGR